jgi:hypothetical protein
MISATRRPEAEILNEISESPLGLQMTAKWGWDRSHFARCLDYACRLRPAIQADRREHGPRVTRLKEQFRRSFGATDADIARLTYGDRHWMSEGPNCGGIDPAGQLVMAEFVAMILVNETLPE